MNCVLIELGRNDKYQRVECRLCGRPIELPARLDLRKVNRGCAIERPAACEHLGEHIGEARIGCGTATTPLHVCKTLIRKSGKPLRCTPLAITADANLLRACVLCESYSP